MSDIDTPSTGRCCGCPPASIFFGMTRAQLMQALADAQAAYFRLMLGGQGTSYSYTQGDGARSVTYTMTSPAMVQALIRQLQQALGIVCRARRPASFIYR
jgi:hypothetical protein